MKVPGNAGKMSGGVYLDEQRKQELILAKHVRRGTAVMLNKSFTSREPSPSQYLPEQKKNTTRQTVQRNKDRETKFDVDAVKSASNPIGLRYWQQCTKGLEEAPAPALTEKETKTISNKNPVMPSKQASEDPLPPWLQQDMEPMANKPKVLTSSKPFPKVRTQDIQWKRHGSPVEQVPPWSKHRESSVNTVSQVRQGMAVSARPGHHPPDMTSVISQPTPPARRPPRFPPVFSTRHSGQNTGPGQHHQQKNVNAAQQRVKSMQHQSENPPIPPLPAIYQQQLANCPSGAPTHGSPVPTRHSRRDQYVRNQFQVRSNSLPPP